MAAVTPQRAGLKKPAREEYERTARPEGVNGRAREARALMNDQRTRPNPTIFKENIFSYLHEISYFCNLKNVEKVFKTAPAHFSERD
jgi:hypothetical protein